MKKLFIPVLLALMSSTASADEIEPSDFRAALNQVTQSAKEMENVVQALEVLDGWTANWKTRKQHHDNNICEYPKGQPELCAWYNQERDDLDRLAAAYKQQYNSLESRYKYAKNRYEIAMSRLRFSVFLGCLKPFAARIHDCSLIEDAMLGAACFTRVWEGGCQQ